MRRTKQKFDINKVTEAISTGASEAVGNPNKTGRGFSIGPARVLFVLFYVSPITQPQLHWYDTNRAHIYEYIFYFFPTSADVGLTELMQNVQ